MPRPNNRPPVNLTPKYRKWAVGSSRDERIDGNPSRGHTAKFTQKKNVTYRCLKGGCSADVSGAALFCNFHLWNCDHPSLQALNTETAPR